MNILHAFILGIIQGLTEFIPVSSTAHLLIASRLMNIPADDASFAFNVLVQLGTTMALIVYFWKDMLSLVKAFFAKPFSTAENRLAWYILIATVPALLAGVLLKKYVEGLFGQPLTAAAIRLFAAAIVLTLAERFGKRTRKLDTMNWLDALFVGIMQVLAVFPGASRSGVTISGGMFRGFDRPAAARFAFLMSVPVMLAASGYETYDLLKHGPGLSDFLPLLTVGFITAGVVGWFTIKWLLGYLNKHSLYVFAIYCAVLAAVCVILQFVLR